jgi:HSP20 family protein
MFSLVPRRRERPIMGFPARREYTPFDLLRQEFASVFNRAFPMFPFEATWEPEPWGIGVEELENEIVVRAELPGFEMKELEIALYGNELTIKAEHPEPVEGKAAERPYAKLERTVTLPLLGIEPEKIEATYRNGILEVHVPRKPEAKPRHIEVKA